MHYRVSAVLPGIKEELRGRGVNFSKTHTYIRCDVVWGKIDHETGTKIGQVTPVVPDLYPQSFRIIVECQPAKETVLVVVDGRQELPYSLNPETIRFSIRHGQVINFYGPNGNEVRIRELSIQFLRDNVVEIRRENLYKGFLPFDRGGESVRVALPPALQNLAGLLMDGYQREQKRLAKEQDGALAPASSSEGGQLPRSKGKGLRSFFHLLR